MIKQYTFIISLITILLIIFISYFNSLTLFIDFLFWPNIFIGFFSWCFYVFKSVLFESILTYFKADFAWNLILFNINYLFEMGFNNIVFIFFVINGIKDIFVYLIDYVYFYTSYGILNILTLFYTSIDLIYYIKDIGQDSMWQWLHVLIMILSGLTFFIYNLYVNLYVNILQPNFILLFTYITSLNFNFNNLSFSYVIYSQLWDWFPVMDCRWTYLFNNDINLFYTNLVFMNSLFIYILMKIKFKFHILIKLLIKSIINIIIITGLHFLHNRLHFYFRSYTKTLYCFNLACKFITKFINDILNYFRFKWYILAIVSYFTLNFIFISYSFPSLFIVINGIINGIKNIILTLHNFMCDYWPSMNNVSTTTTTTNYSSLSWPLLEDITWLNILLNEMSMIFMFILFIYCIRFLIKMNPITVASLSVLSLQLYDNNNNLPSDDVLNNSDSDNDNNNATDSDNDSDSDSNIKNDSDNDTDNDNKPQSDSDSDNDNASDSDNDSDNASDSDKEHLWWSNQDMNFKDLTMQDKMNYIKYKFELKGLDSNDFLTQHFSNSLLSNTSGTKLDVDNFLNTNLNILLNDHRNTQLNKHSFVRFKPFILNNKAKSYYSPILPYIHDNSWMYELEEHNKAMEAAKNRTKEEIVNNPSTSTSTSISTDITTTTET